MVTKQKKKNILVTKTAYLLAREHLFAMWDWQRYACNSLVMLVTRDLCIQLILLRTQAYERSSVLTPRSDQYHTTHSLIEANSLCGEVASELGLQTEPDTIPI